MISEQAQYMLKKQSTEQRFIQWLLRVSKKEKVYFFESVKASDANRSISLFEIAVASDHPDFLCALFEKEEYKDSRIAMGISCNLAEAQITGSNREGKPEEWDVMDVASTVGSEETMAYFLAKGISPNGISKEGPLHRLIEAIARKPKIAANGMWSQKAVALVEAGARLNGHIPIQMHGMETGVPVWVLAISCGSGAVLKSVLNVMPLTEFHRDQPLASHALNEFGFVKDLLSFALKQDGFGDVSWWRHWVKTGVWNDPNWLALKARESFENLHEQTNWHRNGVKWWQILGDRWKEKAIQGGRESEFGLKLLQLPQHAMTKKELKKWFNKGRVESFKAWEKEKRPLQKLTNSGLHVWRQSEQVGIQVNAVMDAWWRRPAIATILGQPTADESTEFWKMAVERAKFVRDNRQDFFGGNTFKDMRPLLELYTVGEEWMVPARDLSKIWLDSPSLLKVWRLREFCEWSMARGLMDGKDVMRAIEDRLWDEDLPPMTISSIQSWGRKIAHELLMTSNSTVMENLERKRKGVL
jgi:hypothetical protein